MYNPSQELQLAFLPHYYALIELKTVCKILANYWIISGCFLGCSATLEVNGLFKKLMQSKLGRWALKELCQNSYGLSPIYVLHGHLSTIPTKAVVLQSSLTGILPNHQTDYYLNCKMVVCVLYCFSRSSMVYTAILEFSHSLFKMYSSYESAIFSLTV